MASRFFIALLLLSIMSVDGGPAAYGICQTGCNSVVVACYAAAGVTFGTVTAGVGTPAAIVACNVGLGTCMAACVAAGCAPTP
eukprot:CAMPEP_0114676104 /NCGR_PEP_ID=MMETSP0191-20121206/48791_1 /TAXON_ID=126664 /ORGANISM="Sorites sp." /LENGTH=82 /DNA_ID=CAMNT_0001946547 /DNA_START=64 /DNA_END=312 /DNA_ORIENTATION=+